MAFIDFVTSFEKVKVQLVDSFPDLCVYISKSKSEAKGKDEIWFFEDGGGSDKLKVKIVSNFGDIKVKYVSSKSQAGWKNKTHKLQGRIRLRAPITKRIDEALNDGSLNKLTI